MYYQQTYNPVNSIIIKKSTHSTINAALSNHSNHIYIFSGSLKTVAHTSTCHKSHHILGLKEIYRTLGQKEYILIVGVVKFKNDDCMYIDDYDMTVWTSIQSSLLRFTTPTINIYSFCPKVLYISLKPNI